MGIGGRGSIVPLSSFHSWFHSFFTSIFYVFQNGRGQLHISLFSYLNLLIIGACCDSNFVCLFFECNELEFPMYKWIPKNRLTITEILNFISRFQYGIVYIHICIFVKNNLNYRMNNTRNEMLSGNFYWHKCLNIIFENSHFQDFYILV